MQLGSALPLCDDTLLPLLFICFSGLMGLQPPLWPESCAWRPWHFPLYPLTACMNCLESESRLANTATHYFFLIKKLGGGIPSSSAVKNLPATAGNKFDPWSRKIPHAMEHAEFRTLQLVSLCSRAWELQLLKPACPRATTRELHKRSHHNEKPVCCN